MAQEKGTPRKFTIPTVDEVYGSEAAAVRPLFKPSGTLAAPRGGEGAEVSSDDGRLSGRRRGSAGTTASAEGPPQAPAGDLAAKPSAKHSAIVVSPRQRGNPVLKFVRNVPWEFGETTADYILGQTTCALYL
uniref:DNA excision repair protein ERCC-1 n=1 Tax=Pristiophorus japonicus TaxID=55135 RepID=UPI00398E4BE6